VLALPGCEVFTAEPGGLPRGLLDGALAPFAGFAALFGGVEVYAASNDGWPYASGFVLGAVLTWVQALIKIARVLLRRTE
jgi:hypothetical protein